MKTRFLAIASIVFACTAFSGVDSYGQVVTSDVPDNYREILAIRITDIDKNHEVSSADGKHAAFLSFGGFCDNDYFKGSVQPGSYDFQRSDGTISSLSARYVMKGVDVAGDSCKIIIENNAVAGSKMSKPEIITDSNALSFLNTSDLIGILDNNGPFTIRIYSPEPTVRADKLMIPGSHGLLAATVECPPLKSGERCPAVIICHGFGGSRNGGFLEDLAHRLPQKGVATIRFDFNGHGDSEGNFKDMTVLNEIEDAKCIYQYVRNLPFVNPDEIAVAGHSQGGVVTAMLAGELGVSRIKAVVLLCAAAVLRDDCIRGETFGKKYNPLDPPETVDLGGGKLLGRDFITSAFSLPIYETAERYHGKACIIHGTGDRIVPYTYSLRFRDIWPGSEYHELPGYDHGFNPQPSSAVDIAVDYLTKVLATAKN